MARGSDVNIHEYQAEALLAKYGVNVPVEIPCRTVEEVRAATKIILAGGLSRVVVKAQIHAGGRGKGIFKNGFQGGVKAAASVDEAVSHAKNMLGNVLVTSQTGPAGRRVNIILVAGAPKIKREFYLAVLLDRAIGRPLVMASTEGGMDIEEVAAKTPEKILKEWIDPAVGLMPFQARQLVVGLGLKGDLLNAGAKFVTGVFTTWWECDASLVEINPMCVVELGNATAPAAVTGASPVTSLTLKASGEAPDMAREARAVPLNESVMALDAKISLDDNGLYRHKDIQAMRDPNEEAPLEIEASKHSLNYIKLDGNIACLVNGAGLAMATMDIIKHFGGEPANFLDVGGGANVEQVTAAFKIILQDPNVKGILVNIFGGIMDCNVIAVGIVAAVKEMHLNIPLVVRLEGNNVVAGKKTLADSGLKLITADSMADAAQKAVKAVGK
jgi:succinyl-CoA synthetase beta subunit